MIVVLGCPAVERAPLRADDSFVPAGCAVDVARAAVEAGALAELVGAVGDDAAGDAVVVGLARAHVGHAALLRAPGAVTPLLGADAARAPTLQRADVELGLSYLLEYRVLVVCEPLSEEAAGAAIAAARYQSAQVIAIVGPGETVDPAIASAATVLEAPAEVTGAFARMVGRFAAALDGGTSAATALASAALATGWSRATTAGPSTPRPSAQ